MSPTDEWFVILVSESEFVLCHRHTVFKKISRFGRFVVLFKLMTSWNVDYMSYRLNFICFCLVCFPPKVNVECISPHRYV